MYALEITDLKKTYKNGVEALKGINLKVASGDFFALLGANGAGKSTTIGLISTLLVKTAGTIKIQGYDIDKQPEIAKSCLGIVPQEINLGVFETATQILINQAGYYGIMFSEAKNRAESLLKKVGLWEKRNTMVRHLSGGMKRRLMIARALIHKPKVLILDEPTAGVDIEIRRSMWDFLRRTNAEGTTIILTTHYLEEAEQLCKNLAIIDKGEIVKHSSMKDLLQNMHYQTFVFTMENGLETLPDLSPFEAQLIDPDTFELRMNNKYSLNDIFALLNERGIRIHTLRNKTNRLEELFLDLIKHDPHPSL